MAKYNHHTYTVPAGKLVAAVIFISLALFTACNKNSTPGPAQANTPPQAAQIDPQQIPAPAGTVAAPNALPAGATGTVVATPNGAVPNGQTAPPKPGEIIRVNKTLQVTGQAGNPNDTFGIKPTPTPTPAPTPPVEVVDGKIKQQWEAPAEFKGKVNPLKITPEIVKQGKALYSNRCDICHGAQGKGNGGYNSKEYKQATNLTSTMVQANTDGELFYKVSNARDRHPSSKILYTDEERWMIVAFLRTLK